MEPLPLLHYLSSALQGLSSLPELNGKRGTIVALDPETSRWQVKLDGGSSERIISVKAEKMLPQVTPWRSVERLCRCAGQGFVCGCTEEWLSRIGYGRSVSPRSGGSGKSGSPHRSGRMGNDNACPAGVEAPLYLLANSHVVLRQRSLYALLPTVQVWVGQAPLRVPWRAEAVRSRVPPRTAVQPPLSDVLPWGSLPV